MSNSPAFQLYPADLLSSPKVALMTNEEFGAYVRLLCYAWLDADCTIPDDDEQLAAMSRMGEGWLKGSSKVVRACFDKHPQLPGRLVNVRLYEERIKQAEWREKCAAGGKKSAQTRRTKALEQLKGSSRVVQPPFEGSSKTVSTKTQHSSLQSSVLKNSAGANAPAPGQLSLVEDGALEETAEAVVAGIALKEQKQYMRAALEERFGPTPDPAAQNGAIKWLLANGYTPDQCVACLDDQIVTWAKGRVSWLTVKTYIGSWTLQQKNGAPAREEKKTAAQWNAGGTGKVVL